MRPGVLAPLGGVGASLALIGAYVLAGELTKTDSIAAALAAYEYVLRPVVKKSQSVPKLVPRLVHPRSRAGVTILRAVQRLVATPFISTARCQGADAGSAGVHAAGLSIVPQSLPGLTLIRKPHSPERPFFFSNSLLSFDPAMPRIRLRFQTLLFGLPAFMRCASLEPDGMFS